MPAQSNPPRDTSTPEFRAADSLPSALLLALTGGSLDAFIYLNHGHVFAAVMTGNGVFLGLSMLHHEPHQVLLFLLPIVTFFIGMFCADLFDKALKHHAVTVGLVCEIAALFVASFLPGSCSDLLFVPMVAFFAAFQVASFRKVDAYAYNSTFITSNLRSAADGLYDALNPATRKEGLRKCRELSFIVVAFLAGATIGAFLAPRIYNHTLWFVDLPLVAVLLLALRRDETAASSLDETPYQNRRRS